MGKRIKEKIKVKRDKKVMSNLVNLIDANIAINTGWTPLNTDKLIIDPSEVVAIYPLESNNTHDTGHPNYMVSLIGIQMKSGYELKIKLILQKTNSKYSQPTFYPQTLKQEYLNP